MPLVTSGSISIGGSTSGSSINLELGRSATATSSLGESALRTLAGVSSGAISLSNFYGKSSLSVNYPSAATATFYGSDYCGSVDVQVDAPTISGGTGTYSYSWTRISGSWFTINSSTAQRPIWSIATLCNDSRTEIWRVTVTSGSTSVTDDVEIYLAYFTL